MVCCPNGLTPNQLQHSILSIPIIAKQTMPTNPDRQYTPHMNPPATALRQRLGCGPKPPKSTLPPRTSINGMPMAGSGVENSGAQLQVRVFRAGRRLTQREWLSEMFTEVEDEDERCVDLPASQDRENECSLPEERGGEGEAIGERGRGREEFGEDHARGCLAMWGETKERRGERPRYVGYPGRRDASSWERSND